TRLVDRTHSIITENLSALDGFFSRNEEQFSWARPKAGSVCFPALRRGDIDQFSADLVQEEGVLLLPASQFGYSGNHFRLGYGRRDMIAGLSRLEDFARHHA